MQSMYFILSFEWWCWQSALRSNLQYAALSTLRRLPLDSGNPAFLHRAVQGCVKVQFSVLRFPFLELFYCTVLLHIYYILLSNRHYSVEKFRTEEIECVMRR